MKTCTSALSFPHLVKGTILVCNSTINYTYEMNLYLIFKIFFVIFFTYNCSQAFCNLLS